MTSQDIDDYANNRPALPAVQSRPQCPHHGDTMRARSSRPAITYYYCVVLECEHHRESIKVPRKTA